MRLPLFCFEDVPKISFKDVLIIETRFDFPDPDVAKKFNMLLVLEEVFVNVCHYAYSGCNGDVVIFFRKEDDGFVLEIIDFGKPSYMRVFSDLDTILNVDERFIGGFGIF